MQLPLERMNPTECYHLLIQTVLPRPVAWILTANAEGSDGAFNLAPYSFFAPVCANPPTFVVSIGQKPCGAEKDTLVNLQRDGRCVVHIASAADLAALNNSSASLAYGVSEVDQQQLELVYSDDQVLPRLEQAPVAFYCRLRQQLDIGPEAQHVVFLEADAVWLRDDIVSNSERLTVSAAALNPLARLGGSEYATLGSIINLPRPA